MNKSRTHNLPSISTLLKLPSSPPSPPRIVVVDERNETQPGNSNNSKGDYNLSVTLSPMLSPIDSYASSIQSLSPNTSSFQPPSPLPSPSMLSLPPHHSLPPLQGDDPPRRLTRHPSISSLTSVSPKPSFNSLWTSTSPSPQPSYCSPSPTLPPQPQHQADSPMAMSLDDNNSIRSVSPVVVERPPLPPSTQIVLSESGQPILKRRRGRPPSMREPALEGGWTFLTPTVWDVKQDQSPSAAPVSSNTTTTTAAANAAADSVMNGSMAAFTSSNMDMVLQMPRKKRGRKPKTHIVGNSCFVWKDITASRRSTKVIKEQQQQQQKASSLRRLEQASP
ncbi:unnamed protein product [Mucor hiemalis]